MADAHAPRFSPEARARAERTIEIAEIFAANTGEILAALPYVPDGFVLVGVVDADHSFSGLHQIATAAMVDEVPGLEGDGWAMVFPPGTTGDDIARRTAELADINRRRIAAIDRIAARGAERD
ncbi:MAG: hypothetical protein QOG80_1401 [Pseudonocardiales bacterium]|jgi:hypothetical protein|nr:hypothetical protein [Pseudonocardiales bacterium]